MANYVQISGFNAYPARKYSTRTITQIDPYLYLGHYVKFSYDFNYYQELIRILKEGGSFEQKEKHNEKPTIFTFDKDKLELTVDSPINRRLSLTYKLNQEVVNEIIELIKEDTKNTMADDVFREALKAANAKERLTKHRNKPKIVPETAPESTKDDLPSMPKPNEESFTTAQINDNNDSVVSIVSETAPESPKEEKVEEIKLNEETLATDQINDNNDSIIGQSVTETKQEEVKTKTVWDVKEVKDIVFKVEKIDENKLDEVPLGKKSDIAGYFWPSHEALLAKLYGIRVPTKENGEPDKEAYKEIRMYFGKIFNVAV